MLPSNGERATACSSNRELGNTLAGGVAESAWDAIATCGCAVTTKDGRGSTGTDIAVSGGLAQVRGITCGINGNSIVGSAFAA